MQRRRPLTHSLAAAASLAATFVGVLIAADCDAPDWMQAAMLTALPLAAAIGAGAGAYAWGSRRFLAIVLGIGVGVGSWLASVLLWIGSCST